MKSVPTVIDIARQLMTISEDLRKRRSHENTTDYDKGYLYDFDQMWGSTALGFPGVGGSAMTWARTYVFIPYGEHRAFVYFNGEYAYTCSINDRFNTDLNNHCMASLMESGRYNNEDN